MNRPIGKGVDLAIPLDAQKYLKRIVVFPDGSIGVMWHEVGTVSFTHAIADGDTAEPVEPITYAPLSVGRVLYVVRKSGNG